MAYLTSKGYLQEELLTEHIVPGYLNHTIYMSILTFYSFLSLYVVAGSVSTMASCAQTFEMEVMYLCFFTFTDEIVIFQIIWKILRIKIVKYEAFYFLMRLCSS